MPAFLITYDLRKKRDYPAVYALLEKWKAVALLESVWLARFKEGVTASQIMDALRKVADFDDGLAIIELKPQADWSTVGVPAAASDWLQKYVTDA